MWRMRDRTRVAILNATDQLFRERGFRATTIEDIADRAGIGKGTVYLHFSSKFEIAIGWFREMHDAVMLELGLIAGSTLPIEEKLRRLLETRMLLRYDNYLATEDCVNELLDAMQHELLDRRDEFTMLEVDLIAELLKCDSCTTERAAKLAETALLALDSLQPYNLSKSRLSDRPAYVNRLRELSALLAKGIVADTQVPN